MPSKVVVYKDEYSGHLVNDCSGYFKKITARLRVLVPQLTADGIIDYIASSWVKIGRGAGDGPKARDFASQGYFVVALLKAKDHVQFHRNPKTGKYDVPHAYLHGHLAIVLPTQTADYPYVICGSTSPDGRSDGSKKVYEKGKGSPWKDVDAPNVQYYRTPDKVPDPVN